MVQDLLVVFSSFASLYPMPSWMTSYGSSLRFSHMRIGDLLLFTDSIFWPVTFSVPYSWRVVNQHLLLDGAESVVRDRMASECPWAALLKSIYETIHFLRYRLAFALYSNSIALAVNGFNYHSFDSYQSIVFLRPLWKLTFEFQPYSRIFHILKTIFYVLS